MLVVGGHFLFFVCYVEGSDILVGIHCLRNPLDSRSEHMLCHLARLSMGTLLWFR